MKHELVLVFAVACARREDPVAVTPPPTTPTVDVAAPIASTSAMTDASSCAPLSAADIARVRAAVPRLHAGLSRPDVIAALGVNLDCLPGGGQGGADRFITIHSLDAKTALGLNWERKDGGLFLVTAEIKP